MCLQPEFAAGTQLPGPIYPGYADRLAAGNFKVSESAPGFPVSGKHTMSMLCCHGHLLEAALGCRFVWKRKISQPVIMDRKQFSPKSYV